VVVNTAHDLIAAARSIVAPPPTPKPPAADERTPITVRIIPFNGLIYNSVKLSVNPITVRRCRNCSFLLMDYF